MSIVIALADLAAVHGGATSTTQRQKDLLPMLTNLQDEIRKQQQQAYTGGQRANHTVTYGPNYPGTSTAQWYETRKLDGSLIEHGDNPRPQ